MEIKSFIGVAVLASIIIIAQFPAVQAMPIKYQLLSSESSGYIIALSDGTVTADGSDTDSETEFHLEIPSAGKYRFESVQHSGEYLKVASGTLTLGTPSGSDADFERVLPGPGTHAYHVSDCYMAFDSDGSQASDTCNLTSADTEVHLTLLQA